ncbi:MAG: hypothetical protein RR595_05095 [Lysinibacillus sp.]
MQQNLYTPSLADGEVSKSKSFEVGQLFIVAILGGIIAIAVLGIRNAKWLHVEKKYIHILTAVSVVLYVCKLGLVYAITHQIIDMDEAFIKLIGRLFGAVCFFVYFAFLKRPFNDHKVLDGTTESLIGPGLTWCIIAILIDGLLNAFVGAL